MRTVIGESDEYVSVVQKARSLLKGGAPGYVGTGRAVREGGEEEAEELYGLLADELEGEKQAGSAWNDLCPHYAEKVLVPRSEEVAWKEVAGSRREGGSYYYVRNAERSSSLALALHTPHARGATRASVRSGTSFTLALPFCSVREHAGHREQMTKSAGVRVASAHGRCRGASPCRAQSRSVGGCCCSSSRLPKRLHFLIGGGLGRPYVSTTCPRGEGGGVVREGEGEGEGKGRGRGTRAGEGGGGGEGEW